MPFPPSDANTHDGGAVLLVGAGRMGRLIAQRLVLSGIDLHVFDRDEEAVAQCVSAGAVAAGFERIRSLDYDRVLLCLPEPAVVRWYIDLWLAGSPQRRSVIADLTTVAPSFARSAAAELERVGIRYLDAPVSGGERGAGSGEMSVMVGASATDFEVIAPLLRHVGDTVRHVGAPGAGSLMKAINQFVYLSYNYVFAQGVRMVREAGLPEDIGLELLRRGAAGHPLINDRLPGALESEFRSGFLMNRCLKDLDFLELDADAIDSDVADVYRIVRDKLRRAVEDGKGDLDILALMR
ncbi:MAG: 2-hydroxy-3-oxopropionate reductase [Noviherbaspirillum sp.]|nr:2-hydroxy-3-oxopropionate reductase [Noviherbaspirillum sp.]